MFSWKFTTKLFDGFTILRWTDFITPREYVAIEKHAAQSILTYLIGKEYEELTKTELNWQYLVKNNVLGLLSKIATSDIKSTIHAKIKNINKKILNNLILDEYYEKKKAKYFKDEIVPYEEFDSYLKDKEVQPDSPERKIAYFAHKYSTYREFCSIELLNGLSPDINIVRDEIRKELTKFNKYSTDANDMILQKIFTDIRIQESPLYDIFSYFEKLRPQIRWSQTCRLPKTTVLGHSMYVAVLTYFAIKELKLENQQILVDSFYAALFHDLPESFTRDIISPVKNSIENFMKEKDPGISELEYDEVNEKVLLKMGQRRWCKHFEFLIGCENSNGQNSINPFKDRKYSNSIVLGELIEYMDKIAAYVEAKMSIKFGIDSEALQQGVKNSRNKLIDKTYTCPNDKSKVLLMNDYLSAQEESN